MLAVIGDGVGDARSGRGATELVGGIHAQTTAGKVDACEHAQWQLAPAYQHGAVSSSTELGMSARRLCTATTLAAFRLTTVTPSGKQAVANIVLPSTSNAHSHTLTARRWRRRANKGREVRGIRQA